MNFKSKFFYFMENYNRHRNNKIHESLDVMQWMREHYLFKNPEKRYEYRDSDVFKGEAQKAIEQLNLYDPERKQYSEYCYKIYVSDKMVEQEFLPKRELYGEIGVFYQEQKIMQQTRADSIMAKYLEQYYGYDNIESIIDAAAELLKIEKKYQKKRDDNIDKMLEPYIKTMNMLPKIPQEQEEQIINIPQQQQYVAQYQQQLYQPLKRECKQFCNKLKEKLNRLNCLKQKVDKQEYQRV